MGHAEVWGTAGEDLLFVGLTGGIASGKSEVDRELESLGALVIDADQVARDVVLPGKPTLDTLVTHFGTPILDDAGHLDRPALADIIFNDDEKRLLVNRIMHPAIWKEMADRATDYAEARKPDQAPAVVLDAALIVDTGVTGVFDILVVVTAPEELRVRRLSEMRGMPESEARARIASQFPDEERVAMADIVIENDGSIEDLRESVRRAWGEIAGRARADHP